MHGSMAYPPARPSGNTPSIQCVRVSAARRRAHVNLLDPCRAAWHRGCVGVVNRQDQAVMKPGRKSIGRVRVDAPDPWMMVTTKTGWKTVVSFRNTHKKQENVSGPLTVSVLFHARRHSQDLRSRMNPSSSVMAASTHSGFPRVPANISATKKETWKNQCTVEESVHRGGAGNLSMACATITTGTSTTGTRSSPGRKALHHDNDIHPQ